MADSRSDDDEPLTKTKLFTLGEDGAWTDMGVGIASVADDTDNDMPILRLDIVTIPLPDEHEEVLLSTPVSSEDIYTVQKGSILVWCDPELGRDMAASFHSKEGCSFIVDKIKEYQHGVRRRKEEALAAQQSQLDGTGALGNNNFNNNSSNNTNNNASPKSLAAHGRQQSGYGGMQSANGSGSTLLDEASSDPLALSSPWSVCKVNLPLIARALVDNKQRIGSHIREYREFVYEICNLFVQCATVVNVAAEREKEKQKLAKKEEESESNTVVKQETDESATAATSTAASLTVSPLPIASIEAVAEAKKAIDFICEIIMIILSQHSTDVKILSQIVEDRNIETIVDIVQYAIGKRDKESGFVSRVERHAMFKDPAKLPPSIVNKIHNFFAVQYLRDLVPQVLEEGEPGLSLPLVSLLLVRARHTMLTELMNADILRNALRRGQSIEHNRAMIGMMLDITTYVKNTSAVGADTKNEVFAKAIELGLLDFIAELFMRELQLDDPTNMCGYALQQASDCLSHLSMWAPVQCCQWLLRNASDFRVGPKFDTRSPMYRARRAALAGGSLDALVPSRPTTAINRSLTNPSVSSSLSPSGSVCRTLADSLTPPPAASDGGEGIALSEDLSADVLADSSTSTTQPPPPPAAPTDTDGAAIVKNEDAVDGVKVKQEEEADQKSSSELFKEGVNDFSNCCLLNLLFEALAVARESVAANAIGDAIYNVGIGSLQLSAVIPMFGMEAVTLRRRILQYWVNGLEGLNAPASSQTAASVPIFVTMIAASQISRLAPDNAPSSSRTSVEGVRDPAEGKSQVTMKTIAIGKERERDLSGSNGSTSLGLPLEINTNFSDGKTRDRSPSANSEERDAKEESDQDSQEEKKRRRRRQREPSLEHDADNGPVHNLPTSSFTRHLRDLSRYHPFNTANRTKRGARGFALPSDQRTGSTSRRASGFGGTGCKSGGARGPRVSSATTSEVTELQCLRVLRLLTKERQVSCTGAFADFLRSANLLGNIAAALQPKTRASNKLCCVAVEFLSELIRTNSPRILQIIIQSHILDAIVRLHETLPRRSSVLSSSILSVFNNVANSVAEAKQRALGGSGIGGFGGSPYLSRLNGGNESSESNPASPDLSLVDHVLLHFSSYVRYFAPNVLRKLERVKETNGDDVADEGESSAVNSCYGEARSFSDSEFNAILAEYGCSPTTSPREGSGGVDGSSVAARNSVSPPSAMDTGTVLSSVPEFDEGRTVPENDDDDEEDNSNDQATTAHDDNGAKESSEGRATSVGDDDADEAPPVKNDSKPDELVQAPMTSPITFVANSEGSEPEGGSSPLPLAEEGGESSLSSTGTLLEISSSDLPSPTTASSANSELPLVESGSVLPEPHDSVDDVAAGGNVVHLPGGDLQAQTSCEELVVEAETIGHKHSRTSDDEQTAPSPKRPPRTEAEV